VIVSQDILVNPFLELEKGKGIKLAEFLIIKKIDVLYAKELFEGKGPEYVFSDAGVEIRRTNQQNLTSLLEHEAADMHTLEVLS
jgi:predicted Fe-Mo cluster-binding NifX family protein